MTLEDAIVYYSEMAKECRRKARIESNDYMDMKDRAYEAEQLADWLNELKILRERIDAQPEIIRCKDCVNHIDNRCTVADHHVAPFSCCQSVFNAKNRGEQK